MAEKILIIEDDKFLKRIINKKFLKEGYNVIEATDGRQGLKIISEQKIDLILLDLLLPEIDGFEVLAKIKANPKMNKIPVIILSNLGQKSDIQKGLKMGANDYLIKAHFTLGEILKKVEAVLNKGEK